MEHFPIIHTNFWDALIAVPLVVIITQLIKLFFPIPKAVIPSMATIIGLAFSLLIAHPFNFWAAIFMGFFYGNAAVGVYASLKTMIFAYRSKEE